VFHRGDGVVVGYYSFMPYFIEREVLRKKQARGLPGRIPCYLIGKLALNNALTGQRLGSQLLASALVLAAPAAAQIGGPYVVVDAIAGSARGFYLHHGFEAVAGREDRLVLRTKAHL
jgi:predicted GNAT family N-acyltransferase